MERKSGISMLAVGVIVGVVIVAIVLILSVVNKSLEPQKPEGYELAEFAYNIGHIRDIVAMKMMENIMQSPQPVSDSDYRWIGVVDGYTVKNGILQIPENAFVQAKNGPNEKIAKISSSLLTEAGIKAEDINKYYITETGKAYYEGFEYKGKTYYDTNTVVDGVGKPII